MLGERIANLRKKRNLSQYELAERLGFSRGKLANYEQGSRQPDYETLIKIADFFNVSVDYLLGKTGNSQLQSKQNEVHSDSKTNEEIYNDSDFMYAMRSANELSEENKQKVFDFIEMMKEVEKARNASKKKK